MGNLNTTSGAAQGLGTANADSGESVTIGVNHKIWDNVISRIEYRHDEADGAGSADTQQETVALNLIYSF